MTPDSPQFVSRGGDKLAAGLDAFAIDPAGWTCADLGCNVGGFTDCLLTRGAAKVFAVDTGYGELAWKLRQDSRVVVMERTNAMHVDLGEAVQLVVIDVAWTRQRHILPAAARLLPPGGKVVTLIKPAYELGPAALRKGRLDREQADAVVADLRNSVSDFGPLRWLGDVPCPVVTGMKNPEYLAHLERI